MGFVTIIGVFVLGVVIATLTFGMTRVALLLLPGLAISGYLFLLPPKTQDSLDKLCLKLTVISDDVISSEDIIEDDSEEVTKEEKPKKEKKQKDPFEENKKHHKKGE